MHINTWFTLFCRKTNILLKSWFCCCAGPKGIAEQLERECSAVIESLKKSIKSTTFDLIHGKIFEKHLKRLSANKKVFSETYGSVCKVKCL